MNNAGGNEVSKDKETAHSAMVTLRERVPSPPIRRVVVLATPDAQSLEVAGPVEVFATANARLREAGRERSPRYRVELASTGGDRRIISAMSGLQLVATAPWNRLSGEIDTLLVVGGIDIWTGESNPPLLRWLRRQAKQVRRLGSVCT